jgi:hypothetical protein
MLDCARPLRREILKQAAAQRHIDELNPSTYAQNGQRSLPSDGEKRQLEKIAFLARLIEEWRWIGSIPGGLDVLASRQEQPITTIQSGGGQGCSHQGGQNQRNPAGQEKRTHVGGVDSGALVAIPGAHDPTYSNPREVH